jgi:hypothetical protein
MKPKRKNPPSSNQKDRHLPFRFVRLPEQLHRQMKKLAERNNRPLSWELRALLIEHLTANGLWPPTEESQAE